MKSSPSRFYSMQLAQARQLPQSQTRSASESVLFSLRIPTNLLSRHTTLSKNYGTKLTSGDIMRISNSQIHSLSAEAYRALRLILNNSGIPTSVISLLTKHTMLLQKHIKRSSHISSRNLPSDLPQHRNVQTIRTYLRFFAILPTSWISRPLLKSENLSPCDV